ncbi:hypothetical protein FY034_05535 [Trichlorobacter lovleyi]|uniref:hypothetical protein n=1 Tax=Trichlorobacter lovleyi TaxID=313985 RepID=UPI00223EB484|nr:hypothetical protein [Trichlorobacter lovleyi]QOX78415.1 hypothetical protein FY034_05535 [Trichlorobacter lovleyi]
MQKIPLNLAAAEMVLARDIFKNDSPTGMPICGKGTVLSDSLISRLQQMGVQSLYVEGHPVWQEGDRCLSEQLADLEKRFSKTLDNRHNAVLLDIYRNHLTTAMGENGGRTEE